MKAETKTIYRADDGTVFESQEQCKKYEDEIKARESKTSYWKVIHSPDLTEGRGWYSATYIECYGLTNDASLWIEDWCYRTFGRPIDFVQDVAPMRAWRIEKIDRNAFLHPVGQRVGDFQYKAEVIRLVPGPKSTGLRKEDDDDR